MKLSEWRLKKGFERRFLSGHPWVFSNELQSIDRAHPNGEWITLCDAGGEALAHGFGNPHSLIAFREVVRKHPSKELAQEVGSQAFWKEKFTELLKLRKNIGLGEVSARICFGEADGIPGFILDRFVTVDHHSIYVAQYHSAGADRNLRPHLSEVLQEIEGNNLEAIIEKNNISSRELEGLKQEAPCVSFSKNGASDPVSQRVQLDVKEVVYWKNPNLILESPLVSGQKTGLFLDQRRNQLAILDLVKRSFSNANRSDLFTIADLFSYVGAWGITFGSVFAELAKTEIIFADSSDKALEFAKKNADRMKIISRTEKRDLMETMDFLKDRSVDLLVCDPPAFVKKKADLQPGLRGYSKLFASALPKVKNGGWFVACSCSSWVSEDDFRHALAQAERKAKVKVNYLYRGGLSEDHPSRSSFPEGDYLKCWAGIVTKE